MVNCLHYLYQWGQITTEQLQAIDQNKLFWCGADTSHPLQSREIISKDVQTGSFKLAEGVFDLIDMIEGQLRSMPKPDYAFGYPISAAIRAPGAPRPAFLAISYEIRFEPVKRTVREVAALEGFECEVTGDLASPGHIMDQVWAGIRGADTIVADITGKNANVFYEIGLAHALGKEVILISQDEEAPFDIQSSRRITYNLENLEDLKIKLAEAFRSVTARYPHEGPEPRF
jgi:hypothetical protein